MLESDSSSDSSNHHKHVGTIKVRMTHENKGQELPHKPWKCFDQKKPVILTEKDIKGRSVTHGVEFVAPASPHLPC